MQNHKIGGRNCIDATHTIKIAITQEDTELASRKDHTNCALSRACMKQEGTDAIVSLSRVYLKMPDRNVWVRYFLSDSAGKQITAFDQGGYFKSGIYELRPAPKNTMLGARTGSSKDKPSANAKKRKSPQKIEGVRTLTSLKPPKET